MGGLCSKGVDPLDMASPFGEAPDTPEDNPYGPLAKQRRRSIALPAGIMTDGVLKEEEAPHTPSHQRGRGYSRLPYTYEATIEAGFDCERVGNEIRKECQDKAYIDEMFANGESQAVVAVLDGHGPHGKKASQDVCSFFMENLAKASLKTTRSAREAFSDCCFKSETLLELSPYDTRVSGTTLTAVILRENELFVGWVGDSRAVLAVRQSNHKLKAVDLSRDHKPDDPREKRRINRMGGEVKRFDIPDDDSDDDDDAPWRVFIRGTMIPGLAMSRSIGDTLATRAGAIPQPDFGTRTITDQDCFLIVASDGLWEVFTSQEAVEWVQRYILDNREEDGSLPGHGENPCHTSVSVAIATEAQRRWVVNFNAKCIVDDTSVAIAYLRNKLYNDQKQTERTKRNSALFMDHSQLRKTVTMFAKRQIEESERASSAGSSPRSPRPDPEGTPEGSAEKSLLSQK